MVFALGIGPRSNTQDVYGNNSCNGYALRWRHEADYCGSLLSCGAGYNVPMTPSGRGRKEMERKYGEVESGSTALVIGGATYRLREVLARWMMDVPEIMTLDGGTLSGDRHWIRFIDKEDRTYVVFEFNGEFDILSEMRVDSLEWEGEDFFGSRWR